MPGITPEQAAELAAPFAPEQVSWRAQAVAQNGSSAMALAYIDARDVMHRLDEVVGPHNWQDRYVETPKGRIICTLAIRIGDEWIEKADGAGNTDVEGDKGAISDALKRAAVKWGIGRYLYDIPETWADCDIYDSNGKKRWKDWKPSGLQRLREVAVRYSAPTFITDDQRDVIATIAQAAGVPLIKINERYGVADLRELPAAKFDAVCKQLNATIRQNSEQKKAA